MLANVTPCLGPQLVTDAGRTELLAAGAGALVVGGMTALATRGRSGIMRAGLSGGAGLGGATLAAVIACGSTHRKQEYFVSLDKAPDYSQLPKNSPRAVHELVQAHFARHAAAADSALGAMQAQELISSYEAVPMANGFVVQVEARNASEFQRRIRSVDGVGNVEQGMV